MLDIIPINVHDRRQVKRFIDLPYRLYKDHPKWVPPPRADIAVMLNRDKHPFYEHSDADFFVADRDGEVVGRIVALENRPYNEHHGTRKANFYLFECVEDLDVAAALFQRVYEWAEDRDLDDLVGPKGFGVLDGYGLLIDGYEHRPMMTMMNYNYPYYPDLVEALGFEKVVDFVSCYLNTDTFELPARIHRIADRVKERGSLEVRRFNNRREITALRVPFKNAYNRAFQDNWEFAPLTDADAQFVMDNAIGLTQPGLVKMIFHEEEIVGFLLGFPDVSAALQRANGRLTPWALADLWLEMKRTNWMACNGAGLVPEFQGVGGNALLYAEMEKTAREHGFQHIDMTQVAESAVQMRRDLENLNGEMYKNHRVYHHPVG
jgi:GNAT superfamily N-acetyltransferase